jgi:D-amino-acid dehydrogenase
MPALTGNRAIVIGGGVVGVSTLYELAADGVHATLLEAEPELAAGASHANGGVLTPGLADPWNSPGVHKHLFESLFKPHSAMKLRLRAIPGLTYWGLEFLRNSTPARHARAMLEGFRLASYSLQRTHKLAADLGIGYDARASGFLKVFANRDEMSQSLGFCRILEEHGLRWRVLDTDGVLELEPSLAQAADRIAAGIFYPDEAMGDARTFTQGLADRAVSLGARVCTSMRVDEIIVSKGRVSGVIAGGEFIEGDVVIAAGVGSPLLSRSVGLSLPVKPAKGYSLTLDASGFLGELPGRPVVDQHMHAAVTPLGTRLRLAGTAEFTGLDAGIRRERIDNLFLLFERLFPHLAPRVDRSSATPWAGFRPMSADGRPFIGPGPIDGLWINTGHGHMGWSMASGSARLLCDMMQGRETMMDASPFSVVR